jgi:hypothetical protein
MVHHTLLLANKLQSRQQGRSMSIDIDTRRSNNKCHTIIVILIAVLSWRHYSSCSCIRYSLRVTIIIVVAVVVAAAAAIVVDVVIVVMAARCCLVMLLLLWWWWCSSSSSSSRVCCGFLVCTDFLSNNSSSGCWRVCGSFRVVLGTWW